MTNNSTLRDLTKEEHTEAENQEFVKVLLSGKISPEIYSVYLFNYYLKYRTLETAANAHGLLDDIPEVKRAEKAYNEYKKIGKHTSPILESTHMYIKHINDIAGNQDDVMANCYVMHMAELSGGQIIKDKIPGDGDIYNFGRNVDDLKQKIRERISLEMVDEAKKCFKYTTRMFQEIMELDIDKYY